MITPNQTANGVLPAQKLSELIAGGGIRSTRATQPEQVQPASIDLRLSRRAYRMQASFLPGARRNIEDRLADLQMGELDLQDGAILERDCVYLAELQEHLALPAGISGKANPKSTTGRLDIFTRLLSDRTDRFNHINDGYRGPLYVEIVPRTFSIVVREGTPLIQLRLYTGDPECSDTELTTLDAKVRLTGEEAAGSPSAILGGIQIGIALTNAEDPNAIVAYRAKRNTPLIDLTKIDNYRPEPFWDPIRNPEGNDLILNPGEFYLMKSQERLLVPRDHAAEMVPFDPDVGEFRIHYAGFFDPGFGCTGTRRGTSAVLEVRSHEGALLLEHGQRVGRLVYSRLTETATNAYGKKIGSTYAEQELRLAKQFRTD